MRRILGVTAALALCGVLATAAQAAPRKQNVVNLTFATYVWQPTTVKASAAPPRIKAARVAPGTADASARVHSTSRM